MRASVHDDVPLKALALTLVVEFACPWASALSGEADASKLGQTAVRHRSANAPSSGPSWRLMYPLVAL